MPPVPELLRVVLRSAILLPAILLIACSRSSSDVDPAVDVFKRFQAALLRGDRHALGDLVTRESRQAVPHLPLDTAADLQPLEILGAERSGYRVHVHVADRNQDGARTRFVVAKERGRWFVDLIETSGFNHTRVESGEYTLKPARLDAGGIDRIRSLEGEIIR